MYVLKKMVVFHFDKWGSGKKEKLKNQSLHKSHVKKTLLKPDSSALHCHFVMLRLKSRLGPYSIPYFAKDPTLISAETKKFLLIGV